MKKTLMQSISGVVTFALIFLSVHNVAASTQNQPQFSRTFTTTSNSGLTMEISGTTESITVENGMWSVTAGGVLASTHYARLKYKVPEKEGFAPTTFYMRSVVVLPEDFYTKQTSYFRIMNTDNYSTTVNGVHFGAADSDELRTGVYFYSDHTMRIRSEHENNGKVEYYKGQLPVGEHVLELYGDVANVAPWWFKVDGVVVASGNARLSPDSVPVEERVITRLVTGIDGAADQTTNAMTLQVKEFTITSYEPTSAATLTPVPPTATPSVVSTNTLMPATQTQIPPTNTPTTTVAAPIIVSSPTTVVIPPTPTVQSTGQNIVNVRVANGNDDVEERATGQMYMNSTDLELVYDTDNQTVGIRFRGINIPKGAKITNAYITFVVDETASKATILSIQGEASPNAAAFTTANRNVSSRSRTANVVSWVPASWSTRGSIQLTPNLASIIQEIVNLSNWTSGNSIVIIFSGNGSRIAQSYEKNSANAPLIHIEYTTTLNVTNTVTATLTAVPTYTQLPTLTNVPPTATLTESPTVTITETSPAATVTLTQTVLPPSPTPTSADATATSTP